ncbi:TetR family transcriptional regulator [Umezawaea tangerina]|uniref:TetR family transcriptional regulator n=2 Tax=Umezawaea tangerina TaxID=84725 RepID=A0A2T0SSB2_9PSEU|nr:TetR family transcriptional regulator [Umezawaea tangerina]
MADIKRIAREQLAVQGGAALSLRAIARELGIVSSAMYRYVPSRDELLTMLIEDAYNAVGDVAEAADAACERADVVGRWKAIGTAVRAWAVAVPSEYALIYGSPVPGYAAPPDRTITPGTRVTRLLIGVISEADSAYAGPNPVMAPPVREDVRGIRESLGVRGDDDLVARAVLAWTAVFGLISFELFGQFAGGVHDPAAHFDHQLDRLALLVGLA